MSKKALNKAMKQLSVEDDVAEDSDESSSYEQRANTTIQVIRRTTHLRRIQLEQDEIRVEYMKERVALEKKYAEKYEEGYAQRYKLVNNEMEPELTEEEEQGIPSGVTVGETDDGIRGFWLQAIGSCEEISDYIDEDDTDLLAAMTDISCTMNDDYSQFTLTFKFAENEYMNNTELTKTYTVDPNVLTDEMPSLTECTGCDIDWKEGKNLTVSYFKKKLKAKSGKNKGQVRTVTKTKPKPSFFHFFSEPKEEDDEDEDEDDDEDGNGDCRFDVETDYDIGNTLRVSIIPEAVFWFTGENGDYDDDDDDDEDEDEDEDEYEDGLDEDDDEDEEDEDEEEKPKRGGRKPSSKLNGNAKGGFSMKSSGQPPNGGSENPECKQN